MPDNTLQPNHNFQDVVTLITEAQTHLKAGYADEAIRIIENALQEEELDIIDTISLYETLIDIHENENNHNQANHVRQQMLSYVEKVAPELKESSLPIMIDLFKEKQLSPEKDDIHALARVAYQHQDYDTAIKLVGQFAHQEPDHMDLINNYLLVGKSLLAKGKAERAYRLLGGLMTAYPESKKNEEVKTIFLQAKSQYKQ